MKTAVTQDLANQSSAILAWLHEGETILLVENGEPLGRIVPERRAGVPKSIDRRELFSRRFAPLSTTSSRDLADIVNENRGEG